MQSFTDEQLNAWRANARAYTAVLLRPGPHRGDNNAASIIWEHGRRNMELHADGRLAIVCPVTDTGDLSGIGIFNLDRDATRAVMEGDPAVQAGVLVYDVYEVRGIPGDALPG
ncbi:hypothetical protein GCM10027052_05150 [Parafrigoribacterium mesophilum]|uniref:hypothetical protein n=1 Tax=Parafrigoribacterium mesophilum TaxID=433646 RepID=UPI0031FDA0BF